MKHTPGPWTVEVHQDTTTIEAKSQTVALDVSNCDAALIAAAPDMLEALRKIAECEDTDGPESVHPWCLIARAAIAKAAPVKERTDGKA